MQKYFRKICLFLLLLISMIIIPTFVVDAATYNYDFWKNVVPSSEGLAYKDTYYGKDIPFGGAEQKAWSGTQKDGTAYTTEKSVWVRKESVTMPFSAWDVNQWEFRNLSDYTSISLHEMVQTKEVIRPQTPVTVVIPNGVPDLHRVQADAKDELAEFIETEFGSLDDYPEIMKTFIQDIVNQTNADFAAAEEIDDIVNILLATKKSLIATEPIASQNPETIEEVKASAKSAVNDYATAYNYQADKQTEINSFVSDANDKIDGSDEILEIVSSFDELKDNVNQVFILVNVVAKDLFISEYASGEGFDRYLEIYNGTDNVVDLSKYALRIFPSGVSGPINDSTIVPLNGSLGTNQTLVIAHENAGSAIAEKADLSSSIACSFDGNDAIALVKKNSFNNWEIIDLFGTILNTGPLNAGISEDSISYEDFKVFGDKIYLLDARHLYKETVIINEMPVEVQGRSCIFVINSEMKWETVYDEFVITDYVKAKLDAFYRFTTPLDEITPAQVKSTDLMVKAPYVPYSKDSSKAAIYLYSAEGLAITEGHIYVADTKHSRVVKINKTTLEVEEVFLTPDDPTFFQYDGSETLAETLRTVYRPSKIVVNNTERLYVIAKGVYEGIMEYGPTGNFNRFMGKNEVVANPLKLFWAKVFSEIQLATIALDLPPEFTNITIDKAGFLYTTSKPDPDDPLASKMIKMINTNGKDVLKRNGYVSPDGDARYVAATDVKGAILGPTIFSAISVNDIGNYTAVDSKRGRLFTYDSEGNLLYISGEKGQLSNSINDPVAVNYFPTTNLDGAETELVLVLDRGSKSIISFATTTFGDLINKATKLYLENDVIGAEQYWREVIKMNSNYELGYIGIGKSLLRRGQYKEAMEYFELGHSSTYYSKAYQQYRDNYLKENFDWIMSGILLGCFVLIAAVYFVRLRKGYKPEEEEGGAND
jgi:hypothetical protein